ncbi:MAG: class I tRNA ligase family protein, partial [Treponema sp.]|nr:class I tRNA ligase family protein [Treponema sp.]
IIFFWVARMIMAGEEYQNEVPFKNVYFTGIVRDNLFQIFCFVFLRHIGVDDTSDDIGCRSSEIFLTERTVLQAFRKSLVVDLVSRHDHVVAVGHGLIGMSLTRFPF